MRIAVVATDTTVINNAVVVVVMEISQRGEIAVFVELETDFFVEEGADLVEGSEMLLLTGMCCKPCVVMREEPSCCLAWASAMV